MVTHTYLSARLTHTYRPGWAHLDRYEDLGQVKLTQPLIVLKHLNEVADYDHVPTQRCVAALSPATLEAARTCYAREGKREGLPFGRWLSWQVAELFTGGCTCEHDCCGHVQWSGYARRTGRRTFAVEISGVRNL